MPRLLLHICCGPCSTTVIERLRDEHDITTYFYNPNIYPAEEYERRLTAARAAASRFGIPFETGPYEPDVFMTAVRGLEHEPENGARCPVCYRLRLSNAAGFASRHSFEFLATTLTLGPQKRASIINPIGHEVSAKAGITFVEADWKKKDGFKRSLELSGELELYRQHYCGCVFSKSL